MRNDDLLRASPSYIIRAGDRGRSPQAVNSMRVYQEPKLLPNGTAPYRQGDALSNTICVMPVGFKRLCKGASLQMDPLFYHVRTSKLAWYKVYMYIPTCRYTYRSQIPTRVCCTSIGVYRRAGEARFESLSSHEWVSQTEPHRGACQKIG